MRDFYQEIIDIIGAGGEVCCVFTHGDPAFENAAHTTFTTKGQGALDGLTVTYVPGARTAFVSPTIYTRNQFRTAWVPWNGSTEQAQTPDLDAWSRDDALSEGLSMGGMASRGANGGLLALLTKGRINANNSEWSWVSQASDLLALSLRDTSVSLSVSREVGSTPPINERFSHILTYDGSGGVTAADGINHFIDGVLDNGTATNNASYVAMEPGTKDVDLARSDNAFNWNGEIMAGLFFTYRVLNAAEAQNVHDVLVAMQRAQRSQLLAGIF